MTSYIISDLTAAAILTACRNNVVKIRRNILKNFIERKPVITGRSPHFRILEKLRLTEENEQIKRVKYQILAEIESS